MTSAQTAGRIFRKFGQSHRTELSLVALDGTKVHKREHRTARFPLTREEYLEAVKCEVKQLLQLAGQADAQDIPDGISIPAEAARRELRLAAIAVADAKI